MNSGGEVTGGNEGRLRRPGGHREVSGARRSPCRGRSRGTRPCRSCGPRWRTGPRSAAARARGRCRGRPPGRGRSPPSPRAARTPDRSRAAWPTRAPPRSTSASGTTRSTSPIAQRLVGADEPAAEDEVLGARRTDQPRQPLRAAGAGDDAEQDLGLAELRALARDAEVGAQRELAPAAERVAGDGGDDRLRDARDRGERGLQPDRVVDHVGVRPAGELLHVGTGGEHLSPP